mmetsp:Transcript_29722/g.5363  ORF Transcript_29722/g.5363 Transcript_29722/m.5363 type:complete len:81 (+) Transcript_29722:370-612(+)
MIILYNAIEIKTPEHAMGQCFQEDVRVIIQVMVKLKEKMHIGARIANSISVSNVLPLIYKGSVHRRQCKLQYKSVFMSTL